MSEEATVDTPWHEGTDWGDYTPSERVIEFKSVADLAKGYDNAFAKIQSKGILIPDDKASDEDKAAFKSTLKQHLGIAPPESPDKYSWKPEEDMSDYFDGYAEDLKKYHEAGLDDETVSMIMSDRAASIKAASEALQSAQADMAEKTKEALTEAWGDEYGTRMKDVNDFIGKHPDAMEALKAMGLANHKAIIELIDDAARSTIEKRPDGKTGTVDAGKEIEQIKASDAYKNVRHPDHEASIRRMVELRKSML